MHIQCGISNLSAAGSLIMRKYPEMKRRLILNVLICNALQVNNCKQQPAMMSHPSPQST
jgi:hypothetical protein